MADDIDIDHLTIDELVALNHRIVERLKFLDTVRAHQEMMALRPGQKVSFDARHQGRQFGTVIKLNRKTVTVITDDGRRWNVAPQLLYPVKDAGPIASTLDADETNSR